MRSQRIGHDPGRTTPSRTPDPAGQVNLIGPLKMLFRLRLNRGTLGPRPPPYFLDRISFRGQRWWPRRAPPGRRRAILLKSGNKLLGRDHGAWRVEYRPCERNGQFALVAVQSCT